MSNMQPDGTLELSSEEMKTLGYQVIDLLVEHFDHLRDQPVTRKSDRPTLEKQLREALPAQGIDATKVLDQIEHDVFSNIMHVPALVILSASWLTHWHPASTCLREHGWKLRDQRRSSSLLSTGCDSSAACPIQQADYL